MSTVFHEDFRVLRTFDDDVERLETRELAFTVFHHRFPGIVHVILAVHALRGPCAPHCADKEAEAQRGQLGTLAKVTQRPRGRARPRTSHCNRKAHAPDHCSLQSTNAAVQVVGKESGVSSVRRPAHVGSAL